MPTVHTYIGNILINKMCIKHIFPIHMIQARYSPGVLSRWG
jgi:hypothetical protein